MSEEPEVTISYLILCHDSPDRIIRLVTRILSDDETGQVVIHFDKNSLPAKFKELKARLYDIPRCHILEHRIKCGWGQWSLVKATLIMAQYAVGNVPTSHYYLLSEFCFPTQPLSNLKLFLFRNKGMNFIECEPKTWIKAGIREDRTLYRHFFNKRKSHKLHRWSYKLQKKLGIKKSIPSDLSIRYGSQWWCLNKRAIGAVLDNSNYYRKIFKYAWIPDEMYFQTVIYSFVSIRDKVISRTLTKYEFDEKGNVKSVYNPGDYTIDHFFCRKVSF